MIQVVSWQRSGVAWQPWRTGQLLRKVPGINYRAFVAAPCEDYGLPYLPVSETLEAIPGIEGADVVHLHHYCLSAGDVAGMRRAAPKARFVITVHGEPDRSVGPRGPAPDAVHVVTPDLWRRFQGVECPVHLIPNHPARGEDLQRRARAASERLAGDGARVLFVPHSHVPQHKDHALLHDLLPRLASLGWEIRQPRKILRNDILLGEIAAADAVWVQFQGYLDILTMECWAIGAVPVVGSPSDQDREQLEEFWGAIPWLSFPDPDPEAIVETLEDRVALSSSVVANRAFMDGIWTEKVAGSMWADFYESLG